MEAVGKTSNTVANSPISSKRANPSAIQGGIGSDPSGVHCGFARPRAFTTTSHCRPKPRSWLRGRQLPAR
jgi:hypothetical protein